MPQFEFLNTALNDFINTIQGLWAPIFQQDGIQILLAISAIAFAVYAGQLLVTHDVPDFIMGFAYTILSLAVLHAVFLYSQDLATGVYNGFLTWGQQVSGESPGVLTPSGVMEQGLQLIRIFWAAAGAASWWHAPASALTLLICTLTILAAFGAASIILLLAEVWVWALIIGASVLLAFAALPWTWFIFPGWGLTVLSACLKIFFLFCVIAVGLHEANGWTAAIRGVGTSVTEDASLACEAAVQALLFFGMVYYIPNLMAGMVVGAAGTAMQAGEAMLGSMAGAASSGAISAAGQASNAIADAATAGATAAISGASTVAQMLLR